MTPALSATEVLARYPAHADTLPALLASRVATVSAAPALCFEAREYSYGDLALAVALLARHLARYGVGLRTPVAHIASNSDLTVLAFLACAELGALFVPMNVVLTDRELSFVIGHSKPRVILARDSDIVRLRNLSSALDLGPMMLSLDRLGATVPAASEVIAGLSALPAAELDRTAPIDPETSLVVVYTSGTTGFPKGVVHSHRNYVWAAEAFVLRMQLQPDDRLLTVLPFFHVNALFYSLGGALAAGATLITTDGFSASRFWEIATTTGATEFNT
ncbi:MAG: AMP-binding protein, partial [Gammaproteobacteria bacterium]